jgi:hypothetical protein
MGLKFFVQCYSYFHHHMIDWLIIDFLPSFSRIFHPYWDITIVGEGLQILGLSWSLRAFDEEESIDFYCVTPAVAWDLGFYGLVRRTTPIWSPLTLARWFWGLILSPNEVTCWNNINVVLACLEFHELFYKSFFVILGFSIPGRHFRPICFPMAICWIFGTLCYLLPLLFDSLYVVLPVFIIFTFYRSFLFAIGIAFLGEA